jgi:4,4'-diaponeurosporenoate glycosyltransferase
LSVVIPARNEERSLPGLIQSLDTQSVPPAEVIVVDDHSSDGTAAVAADGGATVIGGAALPEGWTGKTWACHQGAAVATGELLWFLDADVILAPDALARMIAAHSEHGGLVSVQPFHTTERSYERLSAFCNIVELMGTGAFSAPPRRARAMAFGPCLLISNRAYQQSGGHAHPDVRHLIAEDIGLAARCRAVGVTVTAFAGRDVVAFRMYPGGPRQLVEGWSKMLAYGARHTSVPLALGVGGWVTAALLTSADAVTALGRPAASRRRGVRGRPGLFGRPGLLGRRAPAVGHPVRRAALGYGAWVAQLWWMLRRVGHFRWPTVIAWPLPLVAFVGLFGRSVLMRVTGRSPRWRGRITPRQ